MESKEEIRYHRIMVFMLCGVFIVAVLNCGLLMFNAGNILKIQEVAEMVEACK